MAESEVVVDRKGFKVVGWPDRCDPRAGATDRPPTSGRVCRVDGHPLDLVIWRGEGRPPDGDAVWHPDGCWVALRHAAEAAG